MSRLQTLRPRIATLETGRATPLPMAFTEDRLRGRAAVDRRSRYLRLHPLCIRCEAEGRTTTADVVDHRTPLWAGGSDDYDTNGQSLCEARHHQAKTACEATMRAAGGWLSTRCTCGMHQA